MDIHSMPPIHAYIGAQENAGPARMRWPYPNQGNAARGFMVSECVFVENINKQMAGNIASAAFCEQDFIIRSYLVKKNLRRSQPLNHLMVNVKYAERVR